MRWLKTNTATRISIGPFLDPTDGITPVTSLTVTNCKLTLVVTTAGVPTLVLDTNPTASSGNNDMVHVTGDDAGMFDLELTAANLNYVGHGRVIITDAANHCPVWEDFMLLPAMVYDSLVLGTDVLNADVTQFGGTNLTAAAGIPEVKVASLAADSLTAAAAAADLKTELQAGLATAAAVTTLDGKVVDIQGRIPAALTGAGNIKADSLAVAGIALDATNGTGGQGVGAA